MKIHYLPVIIVTKKKPRNWIGTISSLECAHWIKTLKSYPCKGSSCITLFNHVDRFHDLGICQLYYVGPTNKVGILV